MQYTRRHFLAQTTTASLVGWRGLHAQAPQLVPVPGVEAGQITRSFVLRNVTVIDCTGKPARPGMTVVISANRIESIEPTGDARFDDAETVDATGKFLIPGLWDMHVHPYYSAWYDADPALFIANGVIGARTMGAAFISELIRLRAEVTAAKRLGPRLVISSPTFTTATKNASDPGQARQRVRDAVQDGADFIKVHNAVPREVYFAIIEEARSLKVPVVGHVPDLPPNPLTLKECADAGQKSFEHMAGVFRYMRDLTGVDRVYRGMSLESLTSSQADALLAVFQENHAWLCPTLTTTYGIGGELLLATDARLKYVAARIRGNWESVFRNNAIVDARERYVHALRLVGEFHKAGIDMLAGTDTGQAFCMTGFSLHDELRRFVDAGLSPMDALRTATYKPAQFFDMLSELGTVELGKLAELVLLDANPLDDIDNTTKINMVFTGGRVYRRSALDAILSAVEANARN